jgi:hypothetical protein
MTKEKSPLRQKDIQTGVKQERKRIIALLEECFPAGWDYAEKDPIDSVIALINGETENTRAYRQGVQDERERTIKLLRHLRCNKMHNCGKWNNHYSYKHQELIELINGEAPETHT